MNQLALLPTINPHNNIQRLKRCTQCATFKPRSAFYINRRAFDGKTTKCKGCIKANKSAYDKSAHGRKVNRLRKIRDAFKVAARRAVHNKELRGDILPAKYHTCKCGKPAKNWHHYNGYEEQHWLDIVALCVRCHVDIHDPFVNANKRQLRLAI